MRQAPALLQTPFPAGHLTRASHLLHQGQQLQQQGIASLPFDVRQCGAIDGRPCQLPGTAAVLIFQQHGHKLGLLHLPSPLLLLVWDKSRVAGWRSLAGLAAAAAAGPAVVPHHSRQHLLKLSFLPPPCPALLTNVWLLRLLLCLLRLLLPCLLLLLLLLLCLLLLLFLLNRRPACRLSSSVIRPFSELGHRGLHDWGAGDCCLTPFLPPLALRLRPRPQLRTRLRPPPCFRCASGLQLRRNGPCCFCSAGPGRLGSCVGSWGSADGDLSLHSSAAARSGCWLRSACTSWFEGRRRSRVPRICAQSGNNRGGHGAVSGRLARGCVGGLCAPKHGSHESLSPYAAMSPHASNSAPHAPHLLAL